MDQRVTLSPHKPPEWKAIAGLAARRGVPAQVRMIDGQLAFPDEMPPDDWKELRLATPNGMITLRREPDAITLVTWGNANDALRLDWDTLARAIAEAGGAENQP